MEQKCHSVPKVLGNFQCWAVLLIWILIGKGLLCLHTYEVGEHVWFKTSRHTIHFFCFVLFYFLPVPHFVFLRMLYGSNWPVGVCNQRE